MVYINRLTVDGYKGLRTMDVEFSGINVITGRNNTGKTSLLESIDLVLNPTHLDTFGGNLSNLIHIHKQEFEISCQIDGNHETLQFSPADGPEAVSIFLEILEEFLSSERRVHRRGLPSLDEREKAALAEATINVIQDSISEKQENVRQGIEDNAYVLIHNGESFPYVYFGRYMFELISYLEENKIDAIIEEFVKEVPDIDMDRSTLETRVEDFVERPFLYLPNQGSFLEHVNGQNRSSFIRSSMIEKYPSDHDEEGSSVKKTQIRDYLREHGIINGLEDFDFDELVVEDEDGERHPLAYDFMGDGFKAIVGLLWRLLDSGEEHSIVLLEEPENHMHPGYIGELIPFLIQVASEDDIQLFITTHNVDLIAEFLSDDLRGDERQFLSEEFQTIQLTETVPKIMGYEQARRDRDELQVDLRGI